MRASELPACRYRFLGHGFEIRSDAATVLQAFDHIYARFRMPEKMSAKASTVSLCLRTQEGAGGPGLEVNGKSFPIGTEDWSGQIYFHVLTYLFEVVTEYLILHGSVIQRDGRAVIVSGSSTAGKTTLAVALAKRGHPLLSDELAPVHRTRREVEPFPRRIGIRQQGEFKQLVDIEELPNGRLGDACKPGAIFLLTPRHDATVDVPGCRTIELGLNRMDAAFTADLEAWPEVARVDVLSDRYFPTVRLTVRPTPLIERIDACCRKYGVAIVQFIEGRTTPPDFTATPELTRLTGSAGLIEVAKQVLNGRAPSRLQADLGGSQAALIMELANTLGDVPIYCLTPGRLDELVQIIEDTPI